MRVAALSFVFMSSAAALAFGPELQSSAPSNGSVVPTEECRAQAKRQLHDYFRKEFRGQDPFLDIQYLHSDAIPLHSAAPSYYLWVRASTQDARTYYRTGVARIVLTKDLKCNVTGFISKSDILGSRGQLETYFPRELISTILSMAETPQK